MYVSVYSISTSSLFFSIRDRHSLENFRLLAYLCISVIRGDIGYAIDFNLKKIKVKF